MVHQEIAADGKTQVEYGIEDRGEHEAGRVVDKRLGYQQINVGDAGDYRNTHVQAVVNAEGCQ